MFRQSTRDVTSIFCRRLTTNLILLQPSLKQQTISPINSAHHYTSTKIINQLPTRSFSRKFATKNHSTYQKYNPSSDVVTQERKQLDQLRQDNLSSSPSFITIASKQKISPQSTNTLSTATTATTTTPSTSNAIHSSINSTSTAHSQISSSSHLKQFSSSTTPHSYLSHQQQQPPKSKSSTRRSTFKLIRQAIFYPSLVLLVSKVYFTIKELDTEGGQRSKKFWTSALPIWFHYQQVIFILNIQRLITNLLLKYDTDYYIDQLPLDFDVNIGIQNPKVNTINNTTLSNPDSIDPADSDSADPFSIIIPTSDTNSSPSSQYPTPRASQQQKHPVQSTKNFQDFEQNCDRQVQLELNEIQPHSESLPISECDSSTQCPILGSKKAILEEKFHKMFEDMNQLFTDIHESEEFYTLKCMVNDIHNESLSSESLSKDIPRLVDQTKLLSKFLPTFSQLFYSLRKQTKLFISILSDLNPIPDPIQQSISRTTNETKTKFTETMKKYIVGPSVRYFAQDLRKYTIPIDPIKRKEHRDAQFYPLNVHYAHKVYDIIADLRGYYIKIGQVSSLRSDFLPEPWVAQLKRFQNDCPYTPLEELIPLIESQLGPIADNFQYIDPIPLGAASVGQVHKARLKNGKDVVLKLQYPNVETTFKYDIQTIKQFCQLAQPEQLPMLKEVEKAFMGEFDFAKEAVHLYYASKDLEHKFPQEIKDLVLIPTPIPELCSKHCLTMEYLPGPRLVTYLERTVRKIASEAGKTMEEFMEQYSTLTPPSSADMSRYRQLAKTYDFLWNTTYWLYNNTLGWFTQPYEYIHTTVPVDLHKILKTVYRAHGYQIFHGTVFSSDCHPGNILWLPDEPHNHTSLDGTIGLIDYGQVKSLDLFSRAMLANILVALKEKNYEKLSMLYFFSGHRTVHNFKSNAVELATFGFDYDDEESRRGMGLEQYLHYLHSTDRILIGASDLLLAGRCVFLLRALPRYINLTIKSSDEWYDCAKDFLDTHPLLDQIISAGLEEFTSIYNEELVLAQQKALNDFGSNEVYFVNLDRGLIVQDWCQAVGRNYHSVVYPSLYTSPLPQNLFELRNTGITNQNAMDNNNVDNDQDQRLLPPYGEGKLLSNQQINTLTHNLPITHFLPSQLVLDEVDTSPHQDDKTTHNNAKNSHSEVHHPNTDLNNDEMIIFKPHFLPAEQFWAQRPKCLLKLQQSYTPSLTTSILTTDKLQQAASSV